MTPARTLLVVCAALGVSACALPPDAATGTQADLAVRIVGEAERLRSLLTGLSVIQFPIIVGLGWAASRATKIGMRVLWRLGFDATRQLTAYRTIIDFLIAVVVMWVIVARLIRVAPILSLAGTGLALGALTVALREQLQDVAVGLALVGRRLLREGDRIHVGEHSGTVHRLGLTRVELRRSDGSAIHVPTRLLGAGALVVGHAKHTVPITALAPRGTFPREAAFERARRTALVSPYRAVGTQVEVKLVDDATLAVEVQAWSSVAARDAAHQLEQALAVSLAHPESTMASAVVAERLTRHRR